MVIINILKHLVLMIQAHYHLRRLSQKAEKLSRKEKQNIVMEKNYDGQRILLIALYQQSELRPDIINLLDEVRKLNMYVIGVNTLKLKKDKSLDNYFDCYIERPNFGRDFGSYKSGFDHIYSKGWDKTCPKLLMLNDSIFFSTNNLNDFLRRLVETKKLVLGATENFEVKHHIGSFCISLSQVILQSEQFKSFWSNYKNSDVCDQK